MNEIKIFTNSEFGEIRAIEINNEPWFVGKDVAEILGYERPTKAIADHVDDDDRKMLDSKTQSCFGIELGQRGGWIINESGLYSLILSSKLPAAKQFKHWVTSEVLPAIRKHGAYVPENSEVAVYMKTLESTISILQTEIQTQTKLLQTMARMLIPMPNVKKINTWKAQVSKPLVTKIHEVTNAPIENIYKAIYIAMQDIYGFNQSYAITSYCDKYNLETCSVIDAIADNIEYQEQFINGVKRVVDVVSIGDKINLQFAISRTTNYSDFDDQKVDEDDVFDEKDIEEKDSDAFFRVIEPLVEKYNDNSIHHVAVLRKVYQRMKSSQAWKVLKTRRKCSTIREVIENDPKLIKLYNDTVAEMLAE